MQIIYKSLILYLKKPNKPNFLSRKYKNIKNCKEIKYFIYKILIHFCGCILFY